MNGFVGCQTKLFSKYDDLQQKFTKFYQSGIDTTATYVIKNKTILEEIDFPESFLTYKQDYEIAMVEFKCLKEQYNKQRFRSTNYYKIFNNRLDYKLNNIVKTYRNNSITTEFNNELIKTRTVVHNFTNMKLENDLYNIIVKGPNFIPTIQNNNGSISKECINNINEVLSRYTKALTSTNSYKHGNNIALKLNLNNTDVSTESREYVFDILDECENLEDTIFEKLSINRNTSESEYKFITELAKINDIIINTADKNLGFSINSIQWYVNEYKRQLSDNDVYENMSCADMKNIIENSHEKLLDLHNIYSDIDILRKFNIDILKERNISDIKLPTLNITPKVHKLKQIANSDIEHKLKGRPIVNGFATINTEPSKLLGEMFHKYLKEFIHKFTKLHGKCPIIDGSRTVVDRLSALSFKEYDLEDIFFVCFDFASLYTAIKKWTVFDMIHFLGAFLHLNKSETNLMKDLFNFIKDNAYFTVGNKLTYLQKEGFAMGSYDSCDGSNLVLLKAEYYMLQNCEIISHVVEFFRFIDDGNMIIYIKPEYIKTFIKTLASYYPKELEIEFKVTKFLTTFLDLTYGIGYDTYTKKKCYFRVYQKPFNTYAYINYHSNHPPAVFKGIVQTECNRYNYLSSHKIEYEHMCRLFKNRLMKCDYPKNFIKKHMLKYNSDKTKSKTKINKQNNYKTCRCKVKFCKMYNQYKIYKKILRNNHKNVEEIKICYLTRTKLKTLFLTKKRLHKKLELYM